MVEEPHEADFGGAFGVGMLVAGAADHERARRTRRAVGAEGELVIEPHRHGLAAAHAQVDVEHFGLDFAGHRHDRGQQRGAVAGDDIGELQPARTDLGEIVIEPVRQRGVDIDDVAGRIDREEAAWRVVEIFDRVLQLLEHVFLALAVPRDVGDRPHRVFCFALALAERTNPHPQPAALRAVGARDADLLLLPLALARRLEQAEHRFGDVGIADEDALDRAHVLRARGPRQRQIGGVRIDHMALRVGHRQPVIGVIGDAAHHGVVGGAVGEADDAGGKGEQVEQADHGEQRQHAEDIGLGLGAADGHQRHRHRHDAGGHQQHQHDAAAPPRRFMGRKGLGRRMAVGFGGHMKRRCPSARRSRADRNRPARVTPRSAGAPLLSA